jgi:hypothetical protein
MCESWLSHGLIYVNRARRYYNNNKEDDRTRLIQGLVRFPFLGS